MDLYAYRCTKCGEGSPRPVGLRAARAEQQGHRDTVHHGLAPDGDRITRVAQPPTPAWVPVAICGILLFLVFIAR